MSLEGLESKLFLDMDGLLANLFDTVSHKLYNKSYKDITPEEKSSARKIWVDKNEFVAHFGNVKDFFANLEPFGKNGELTRAIINTAVEFAGEYNICSHPASIDSAASEAGKRIWLDKHLNPKPAKMYFPQNKAVYAKNSDGSPNILVDDFPPYIQAWRSNGGIAIEMRTDDFSTPEQIKTFLLQKLNDAKKQIETTGIKESFDTRVAAILSQLH